MLLRALNQYTPEDSVPPGYARKELGFVLTIDDDAGDCRLTSQYEPEEQPRGRPKLVAPQRTVPNVTRTVKATPMLGCDTAAYVLGRAKAADSEGDQAKANAAALHKSILFDALLEEYAGWSGDDKARVFLRWRQAGCPGLERELGHLDSASLKRLDLDLIAVTIEGSGQLHLQPAAKAFWSARVTASKSGGASAICLSCGEFKPTVSTLPQSLAGGLIPATSTSNVALLSANFPSASRGARGTGLKSAPVCAECAAGAVSAFNALAAHKDHRWGGRSEDRATIWWTSAVDANFAALESASPKEVADLLQGLDVGRAPLGSGALDRFYALSFSGNVARLVVRQWIDLPLAEARSHVKDWFGDSATPDPEHPYLGLSEMARSWGSWIPADGLFATPPDGSREMLLRCALTGVAPPKELLVRAVGRSRAEIHYLSLPDARQVGVVRRRMKARFAVIRLTLNRLNLKERPLSQYLDEERDDPAYLYGRLFAVRESLQHAASGGVNASITDRYFDRASASPVSVERSLAVLEKQHLSALKRKGNKGAAVAFDKRLSDLHDRIGAGGAAKQLSVEDQALWIAGYYQQRQASIRAAQERQVAKAIAETEEN